MSTDIKSIVVTDRACTLHSVPVPYAADRDDIGGALRAYVGTVWMTVTRIESVRVDHRPRNWPNQVPVARVHVDNNGGKPFVTDVDVARGWLSVV